jgi:large repetitive protein
VQATYVSGSGTNALVFSTAIVNGQNDNDGVAIALNALHLNGASLKDAAGNAATITSSAVASNPAYLVDTTAPSVIITSDVATLRRVKLPPSASHFLKHLTPVLHGMAARATCQSQVAL